MLLDPSTVNWGFTRAVLLTLFALIMGTVGVLRMVSRTRAAREQALLEAGQVEPTARVALRPNTNGKLVVVGVLVLLLLTLLAVFAVGTHRI